MYNIGALGWLVCMTGFCFYQLGMKGVVIHLPVDTYNVLPFYLLSLDRGRRERGMAYSSTSTYPPTSHHLPTSLPTHTNLYKYLLNLPTAYMYINHLFFLHVILI